MLPHRTLQHTTDIRPEFMPFAVQLLPFAVLAGMVRSLFIFLYAEDCGHKVSRGKMLGAFLLSTIISMASGNVLMYYKVPNILIFPAVTILAMLGYRGWFSLLREELLKRFGIDIGSIDG